ncbi:MAG TPA: dTMP kinase [Gemmatimonadaceae bacterium]|nr:dTMP kinase [Gemmatimonadaceae bacterium]
MADLAEPHGALIVFEGVEGAGKSTQVRRLGGRLRSAGVSCVTVREPGGTPVGDVIRELLLDPSRHLDPRTEALLFMASRAQLVRDLVLPALAGGGVVLSDRFFLSTYAYQIAGRGLAEEEVRRANALATGGLVPDLTLLLDLPSRDGFQRAERRGDPDRIERSGDAFHARVREAFIEYATPEWQRSHPECGPIALIDAMGSEDEVSARIVEVLAERWPRTFAALAGSHS